MLGSNRRDNNVDGRLKYSLGWPVLKGMCFHMPFSRSLQHSDRLRHIESTVLSVECVRVLVFKICSMTSLSGKWVVRGEKRVRSGRKGHNSQSTLVVWWDFLALINLIGSNTINPSPPKAFTKLLVHVIPTSHTLIIIITAPPLCFCFCFCITRGPVVMNGNSHFSMTNDCPTRPRRQ